MREVSNLITDGIVWLYNTTGAFGMGIFGAVYSPIVLTGLHQSFPAVEVQLISAFTAHHQGVGDFIFIVASMANVAQGAATFALMTLTKDKKTKGLASSAGVSALLGITEPAIFGVNLKFKFPFFCALVGSCIASFIAGIFKVGAVALGSAGFLGFLSVNTKSIIIYVICELISFAIAFAVTFLYGKSHNQLVNPVPVATSEAEAIEAKKDHVEPEQKQEVSLDSEVIAAPVNGKVEDLSETNDEVFSTKMMGDGAAIIPTDGTIYAPVDGKISVAYETKHAYGITSDKGAEVLIHVGIDTVNLKGEHFESFVKQGQTVKKGDKLGTVDIDAVQKAGYDPTVMTIITNTANYAEVGHKKADEIHHGDDFIKVVAK